MEKKLNRRIARHRYENKRLRGDLARMQGERDAARAELISVRAAIRMMLAVTDGDKNETNKSSE